MIKFNENAWLKPYIDMNNMNTDQEKKKIMENVRQNRDI